MITAPRVAKSESRSTFARRTGVATGRRGRSCRRRAGTPARCCRAAIHGSCTVRVRSGSKRCSSRSASTSGCTTGGPAAQDADASAARGENRERPRRMRTARATARASRTPSARRETIRRVESRALSGADARIGVGQQQIGDQCAGGKKERAGGRASGHEKQIARLAARRTSAGRVPATRSRLRRRTSR